MNPFIQCPICGVSIKKKNLRNHIKKIHQTSPIEVKTPTDRCYICNQPHDPPLDTHRYVCDQHELKDPRAVLIPEGYLKLVEKNNEILEEYEAILPSIIFQQYPSIVHGMSLVDDSNTLNRLALYGYILLRVKSVFPDIENNHPLFLEPPDYDDELGISITDRLGKEFSLIENTTVMGLKLYNIIDEVARSKRRLYIISNLEYEATENMLSLYTQDYEKEWRSHQTGVLWPSDEISISDYHGRWSHISSQSISDDFDLFRSCWKDCFQEFPTFSFQEWESLRSWVDFVIAPDGAVDLSEQCGANEKDVKDVLNQVCSKISDHTSLISTRVLSNSRYFPEWFYELARLGGGYKIENKGEIVYQLPVRHWLKLKSAPVLLRYATERNLMGQSFERDFAKWLSFYNKAGIMLVHSNLPIGPIAKAPSQDEEKDFDFNAQLLETNFEIELEKDEVSKKIGTSGEVDFIIYANYSLYLIEAKSVNMENNFANNYLKQKAGLQCSKFTHWIRYSAEFKKMLLEHGIDESDIRSVRILVASCGGTPNLVATCPVTGDEYAIVPRALILNILSGVLMINPVSMERRFSSTLAKILSVLDSDIREVVQVMSPENRFIAMSLHLNPWITKTVTDRRKTEIQQLGGWRLGGLSHYSGMLTWFEPLIGNTGKWIMDQPIELGKTDGYYVYVGTQLSDAGKTLLCSSCKSMIRYFHSHIDSEQEDVEEILSKEVCPFCANKLEDLRDPSLLMPAQRIFLNFKQSLVESRYPTRK